MVMVDEKNLARGNFGGGAEKPVLKYTATPASVNLFLVLRVL